MKPGVNTDPPGVWETSPTPPISVIFAFSWTCPSLASRSHPSHPLGFGGAFWHTMLYIFISLSMCSVFSLSGALALATRQSAPICISPQSPSGSSKALQDGPATNPSRQWLWGSSLPLLSSCPASLQVDGQARASWKQTTN